MPGLRAVQRAAVVVLTGLLAAGCGVYYLDENDPFVTRGGGYFRYEADLDRYNRVETYRFDTYLDRARVTFDATDFSGSFRVEIFDDHDLLIYDRTFVGDGGDERHGDDTAHGDEGDWTVVVTAVHASGLVYLLIN